VDQQEEQIMKKSAQSFKRYDDCSSAISRYSTDYAELSMLGRFAPVAHYKLSLSGRNYE
jgi:hypothetical protein